METTLNTFLGGAGIQQSGSGSMNIGGDVNIGIDEDRCLADLRLTDPRLDKKRIEDTKGGLVRDIYQWVLEHRDYRRWRSDPDMRLLWIRGDPGKGKTMLICGIIDDLTRAQTNMAYFFCQATDSRLNNVTAVLRGLIFSLCSQDKSLLKYLGQKYEEAGSSLFDDVNGWVAMSEILTQILRDPKFWSGVTLVVDALDECVGHLLRLLGLITQTLHLPHLKWVVSSRNWPSIEESLALASHKITLRLELNDDSVGQAVETYIRTKVSSLAWRKGYSDSLRQSVESYLLSKASGTFLWVALVCDKLSQAPVQITGRILKTFPPGLNDLYHRMLSYVFDSDLEEICKSLLAVVSVAYRPLSLAELQVMMSQPQDPAVDEEGLQIEGVNDVSNIEEAISHCGSFLMVKGAAVFFVHQTAQDFILKQPPGMVLPQGGVQQQHQIIYLRSLHAMTRVLRKDIYSLHACGPVIIDDCRPQPDPLAAIKYCCVYWIDHLVSGMQGDLDYIPSLRQFLETELLHWLEALALLNGFDHGLRQMLRLEKQIELRSGSSELDDLIHDICRFMLWHGRVIRDSPLQLYMSCLLFSPTRSVVRRLYQQDNLKWIRTVVETAGNWDSSLLVWKSRVHCNVEPCFYPDGDRFLCITNGPCVETIETISGTCLQRLPVMRENTTVRVERLRLSVPNCRLVAASSEWTVEIWDLNTCNRLRTIDICEEAKIHDLAFDPSNDRHLVLAYGDIISVWDIRSGVRIHDFYRPSTRSATIQFINETTPTLALSIVTREGDNVGGILDIRTGEYLKNPKRDMNLESYFAWLYHHQVICLDGGIFQLEFTIFPERNFRVWDLCTGKRLWDAYANMLGEGSAVTCAALSPSGGSQLGYAMFDGIIVVLDFRTHDILHKFHGAECYQLAFSPDGRRLLSFERDGIVRIRDLSLKQQDLAQIGIEGDDITLSKDGERIATVSKKWTMKVWDTTLNLLSQISPVFLATRDAFYEICQMPISFTPSFSRVARSWNGSGIVIHDLDTGKLLHERDNYQDLPSHSRQSFQVPAPSGVKLGPDGTTLAVAYPNLLQLWHLRSGICHNKLLEVKQTALVMKFSPNGAKLAVVSLRSKFSTGTSQHAQILDVRTGETLKEFVIANLKVHLTEPRDMETREAVLNTDVWMSSDGGRIACFNDAKGFNQTLRVHDLLSGQCLFEKDFIGTGGFGYRDPLDLQFSEDGHFLSWENPHHRNFKVVDIATEESSECDHRPFGPSTLLGLNGTRSWIMLKGKPFLWVPLDFRKRDSIEISQGTIMLRKRPDKLLIYRIADLNSIF